MPVAEGWDPYFQNEAVTLYHGDCVEGMRSMRGCLIDAIVTDPPYCSGGSLESQKNSGGQGHRSVRLNNGEVSWFAADNMTTGGLVWLIRSVLIEGRRLMRPNRSALVFSDWRMVPFVAPALESSGLRYRNLIVWDKGAPGLGAGFRPCHEMVMEFTNGATEYRSNRGSNVIGSRRVPSSKRDHACQKPAELIAELLDVITSPGDLVVDPFAGSGEVLLGAMRSGRRAIGFELDESHCETIARRCSEEMIFSVNS